MGPYCQYCDNRCFVHDPAGGPIILATCASGKAHDLRKAGYNIDLAQMYEATRAALRGLVKASATGHETTADFLLLCVELRDGKPDHLAQLLAGAVLHIATAERHHERQVEEIARLNAELDIARAKNPTGVTP